MTKDQLVLYIERHCADDLLDEVVHETASSVAANVNNSGVESQIDYLLAYGIDLAYLEGLATED